MLNIRKGPGADYALIGKLLAGQQVFIYAEDGKWCKISNNEKWVSKDYLTVEQ